MVRGHRSFLEWLNLESLLRRHLAYQHHLAGLTRCSEYGKDHGPASYRVPEPHHLDPNTRRAGETMDGHIYLCNAENRSATRPVACGPIDRCPICSIYIPIMFSTFRSVLRQFDTAYRLRNYVTGSRSRGLDPFIRLNCKLSMDSMCQLRGYAVEGSPAHALCRRVRVRG